MSLLTKNVSLILISFLLFATACNQNCEKQSKKIVVTDPFFGVEPTSAPQLLVPGLIASPEKEYNGTFSPNGKEFYYTLSVPGTAFVLFAQLQEDNTWSQSKIAPFSGKYPDYDPLFSPDGSRLYFSSSRPLSGNTNSRIWYVERNNGSWGEPQPVTLTGNENNEFYNSLTHDGNIYFNIWSTGKMFKAQKVDTAYVVEELSETINDGSRNGDPFISPNEDYLIFRGISRKDGYGRGDLYISFNINGKWTEPENLGEPINSSANEMCPYVTTDGKIFIFASARTTNKLEIKPLETLETIKSVRGKYGYDNGNENVYYMSADFIGDLRKKHLGTVKNNTPY